MALPELVLPPDHVAVLSRVRAKMASVSASLVPVEQRVARLKVARVWASARAAPVAGACKGGFCACTCMHAVIHARMHVSTHAFVPASGEWLWSVPLSPPPRRLATSFTSVPPFLVWRVRSYGWASLEGRTCCQDGPGRRPEISA